MAKQLTVFVDPERPYVHKMATSKNSCCDVDNIPLMLVAAAIITPFFMTGLSIGRVYKRAAKIFSKRHDDLPSFVDVVLRCFKTCKSLKLILCLDSLELPGLKVMLRLFERQNCSMTLEEWWEIPRRGTMRETALAVYDEQHKNLIPTAAEESGHEWFLLVCPTLERTYFQGVDEIMIRQRVWSR
jgi:hypothetical protein